MLHVRSIGIVLAFCYDFWQLLLAFDKDGNSDVKIFKDGIIVYLLKVKRMGIFYDCDNKQRIHSEMWAFIPCATSNLHESWFLEVEDYFDQKKKKVEDYIAIAAVLSAMHSIAACLMKNYIIEIFIDSLVLNANDWFFEMDKRGYDVVNLFFSLFFLLL